MTVVSGFLASRAYRQSAYGLIRTARGRIVVSAPVTPNRFLQRCRFGLSRDRSYSMINTTGRPESW